MEVPMTLSDCINMSSDRLTIPYSYNVIFNQHNNVGDYQISRQTPSDMSSTMSTSSNPGSPDSMSMPMSSPASVTLSPDSLENILEISVDKQVRNNVYRPSQEPYLVIREQPVEKYRFRYKSEMMGSHGCMVGRSSDKRRKFFPSVELMNFKGTGVIRCSLYTAQKNESLRTLHCHRLVIKVGKDDVDDPHQIPVDPTNGYIAVFRGMGIIHTAKKHIADELVRKKRYRLLEIYRAKNINFGSLSQNEEVKIRAEAEQEARLMNLNVVTLGFEAYVYDDNGIPIPICDPLFSENICNMKSALTGELKICRIDRHFSTCIGGDEVWMLVEKVGKKNIKVRFYEMDEDDNEIWCDYARFTELDVHHQYAIVFRTPPYRSLDIEEQKDVLVQLYRPSDGGCSEPIRFTYRPKEKFQGPRKRARSRSNDFSLGITINPVENGFAPPTKNNGGNDLQDRASNPMLGFSVAGAAHQESADLLREIDMLSVNSTTFEQILLDEEGMESAEFKEFMQNVSFEGYLGTYQSGSMDLTTDSATSRNPRKVVGATGVPPIRPVAQSILSNKMASQSNEGEEDTGCVVVTNYIPPGRHLTGDQLLQIVTKRLAGLMNKKPPPSAKAVADGIRDLFEKTSDSGDTALHIAVQPENKLYLDRIISIINESRTIDSNSVQSYISEVLNSRNKRRETALHRAVIYNQPATVAALLLGGASPNISDVNGYTPLHIAVQSSLNECLEQLLSTSNYRNSQRVINLNTKRDNGFSPLHMATRTKNIDGVKLLVAAGADVNEKDQSYGRAPIHIAVEEESVEILKYLCSQPNVRVNEPNFDGNTALHLACVVGGAGSLELCKILLEANADPRIPNHNVETETNIEDDTGQENSSDTLTIVKQEPDIQEACGKTSFDLAADNEQILEYFESFEMTDQPIKVELKEEEYDLVLPKEEPPALPETFDSETLSELCNILDRTQGWKRLAQLLDYSFLIASINDTSSPTKMLFNYADLHGNIPLERIRSHLSILDENEAVTVIDDMLTRRFLANHNS